MYEQWKLQVCSACQQLKSFMTEEQLGPLIDDLRQNKEDIAQLYSDIREIVTPSTELRRRVDTCTSVT